MAVGYQSEKEPKGCFWWWWDKGISFGGWKKISTGDGLKTTRGFAQKSINHSLPGFHGFKASSLAGRFPWLWNYIEMSTGKRQVAGMSGIIASQFINILDVSLLQPQPVAGICVAPELHTRTECSECSLDFCRVTLSNCLRCDLTKIKEIFMRLCSTSRDSIAFPERISTATNVISTPLAAIKYGVDDAKWAPGSSLSKLHTCSRLECGFSCGFALAATTNKDSIFMGDRVYTTAPAAPSARRFNFVAVCSFHYEHIQARQYVGLNSFFFLFCFIFSVLVSSFLLAETFSSDYRRRFLPFYCCCVVVAVPRIPDYSACHDTY